MAKQGYLTKEEAESAKAIDIIAKIKPRRDAIEAPHFVLHVKELLSDKYGEREVETGGLNVITTLDYDKQKIAEESVKDGMDTVKQFGDRTPPCFQWILRADRFSRWLDRLITSIRKMTETSI
jgi:penicillin-binding protein 1A